MESNKKLIDYLEAKFSTFTSSRVSIDSLAGETVEFPDTLSPELKRVLENDGIHGLYSHQYSAFESISRNEDTLLLSRTASGKTLSFLLPVLNEYKNSSKPFSVLLLYPTKALSRDQESTLGKLIHAVGRAGFGTFDGDTPREERDNLVRSADFIISNPDMLHSGILPNHNRKWRNFLSRLRYIIVDEVHTYRGVFGSHVSNVFRRLLRICETHGSRPCFIASSATIGNPSEHVSALFHREFNVIDKDGSPRSEKEIFYMNPPLIKNGSESVYRKGPASLSVSLIKYATREGIRTICFCRARQEVERLYNAVIEGDRFLAGKVKPYRGGLLPNERRKLEKDLFEGRINTIISTNALELGIDIGDMSLCILSGYPGTVSSFWQQAGRVGRKGKNSVIVMIAKEAPIDQYIIHHPEFITGARSEEAWLSSDNPYILLQHLPCAAYESPLRAEEESYRSSVYSLALETLIENDTLKPYRDYFRFALDDYPAKGVNLRGMTDYNVDIIADGQVIGEIDPIGAMGTLYKDAIYQHLGSKYISLDLDLEKKIATVEKVQLDYFTEAVWESMVEMTSEELNQEIRDSILRFGYIKVSKQPKLYKKIKERSYENVGYGPITLPPFVYETTGFSIFLPGEWLEKVRAIDTRYPDSALYGLSYLLKHTATSICMGDVSDIQTDVANCDHTRNTWKSALFLYDSHEGGVGYSEKIYHKMDEALKLAFEVLNECECESGCPSCVPPVIPMVANQEVENLFVESNASVECTRSLLKFYLTGEYEEPRVRFHENQMSPVPKSEEDLENELLRAKLKKSAEILKKKRDRIH